MKKIILLALLSSFLFANTLYICTPYKKNFGNKEYFYKKRYKITFAEDMNGSYLVHKTNVYELVNSSKITRTYQNENSIIIIPFKAKQNYLKIVKIPETTSKKIYITYFCLKRKK